MPRVDLDLSVGGVAVRAGVDLPEDRKPRRLPAVLVACPFPGEGDADLELTRQIVAVLLEAGRAVATLEARLANHRRIELRRHRAEEIVDDAAVVLHALSLREEIDLGRIGIVGVGTGAIVAGALAGRSDRINGLCLVAPATPAEAQARFRRRPPADEADDDEGEEDGFVGSIDALSAMSRAAKHDRPTLILHGAADRVVPVESALAWRDRLADAGRAVEMILVARGDHDGTADEARSACLARLERFFLRLPARREAAATS